MKIDNIAIEAAVQKAKDAIDNDDQLSASIFFPGGKTARHLQTWP